MNSNKRSNMNQEPMLQAKNLKKYFNIKGKGMLHAVDDVSFDIYKGETLGLVGESGCGKSTVGNVIMRLTPPTGGELFFEGQDIFNTSRENRLKCSQQMQIVFQDPFSSLNPKKTILSILEEPFFF